MTSAYRELPAVDRLINDERLRDVAGTYPGLVTDLARETLDAARRSIKRGALAPSRDDLVASLLERIHATLSPTLQRVINATGVIIHTNLGRAPLSEDATAAAIAANRGYGNLEFDLATGERSHRHVHLEDLIRLTTGAEAGMAVNNNAAAVLLGLSAMATGREVIISRGQLVEIGGGFRIPEIMAQSGARLVEVGTTNRTSIDDYAAAVTDNTAAILRVHPSNFRIVGFTESASLTDLAQLARERKLLLLDDVGSGCLLDTTRFGLAYEPTMQESVAGGADLVFASGDKLLGGPQAGIIAGQRDLIESLKRHPLARAARLDKASIAALAATLRHYVKDEALEKIPVWRMIAMPLKTVDARAKRWARAIGATARVVDGRSMVGGGSLPDEGPPTRLLAIGDASLDVAAVARRLRLGEPPVVARVERDTLLLDPRTVAPLDDRALLTALRAALTND